ncbi:MAG: pyridoxine 5'-phosphate synthase [Kiritimatiellia bacterium]
MNDAPRTGAPPANPPRLGVNVDHVATLRQARHTPYPSPLVAARLAAEAGAHGITIHLREDRRHIQDRDVFEMIAGQALPVNLEMANSDEITDIALRARPAEVCLVPERRAELTTEGGLDAAGQFSALERNVGRLRDAGIAVSLFIAPDPRQIEAAARLRAPYVELHTGAYCDATGAEAEGLLDALIAGARLAHAAGIKVNAGHGINLDNLPGILNIPRLDTLNIGHSIISRAVFTGLREAVRELLAGMAAYAGGRP